MATATTPKIEKRELEIELGVEGRKIVGYAAVFDVEADLGEFRESIRPGAFSPALAHPRVGGVVALFNHDKNRVLGRVDAGTLRLAQDSRGLHVEISPPNTQFARELRKSIERRDVRGQSFQFIVAARGETWDFTDPAKPLRTIGGVAELIDVGPVTFPAYGETTAALRSRDTWRDAAARTARQRAELERLEKKLRGA